MWLSPFPFLQPLWYSNINFIIYRTLKLLIDHIHWFQTIFKEYFKSSVSVSQQKRNLYYSGSSPGTSTEASGGSPSRDPTGTSWQRKRLRGHQGLVQETPGLAVVSHHSSLRIDHHWTGMRTMIRVISGTTKHLN